MYVSGKDTAELGDYETKSVRKVDLAHASLRPTPYTLHPTSYILSKLDTLHPSP